MAPPPATVSVIATSVADPTKSASANVTIVPVVVVTVSPVNASVPTGTTQQFNASVTGTSNTVVGWSVAGAGCSGVACGTIDSSGLYTAPGAVPSPGAITVTATSVADPTKSGAVNLAIVGSMKNSPALPTLPRATVDLTMPVQTGTVRNVQAGNSTAFQNAINNSSCGDTIVLAAGSIYTGNFTVPNKSCTGWVLIESSQVSQLPSGHRVGPSNVASMATIVANVPMTHAIQFQASAHNWRLIGLEVKTTIGMTQNALIETDVGATSLSQLPNYIIVDRCYVHADPAASVRRGMDLNVSYGAVVDSYFSEFHDQVNGGDSQTIAVWNGPGPFLYQNNFLSAASEGTMFGGADPGIANLVPSDITIVGNHYWKNYAAWKGAGFIVKNGFEFKNAQRVLIDGNVDEYVWADAQVGVALSLKSVNQNGGCNWCVLQDVSVTHNIFRHAATGIEVAPAFVDNSNVSLSTNRILIQNNVFSDISTSYGGNGWAFEPLSNIHFGASDNITIDHNTAFADTELLALGDSGTIPNFQFTNNLGSYGLYGIKGNAAGIGKPSLDSYVPTGIYNDVVLLTSTGASDGNTWPSGTFWNTVGGGQFTNYSSGIYQLLGTSPYHNAGTDGKDIGVWDWTTLTRETTNAFNGTYP